jgi:hypothetical protein
MLRTRHLASAAALSAIASFASTSARADSFPPGVTYPLKPATLQPSGLAQPLPSSRRYVMVWKDQLIPDAYSLAEKDWVVTHYVGTQKLFQRQIDEYRTKNPSFMMLVYHLAFGLNGADQTNPVGNITGANVYGQEDTDTFTPYVAAHSITRENAYQHSATPASTANRVSYPDPYWLMDVASTEWRTYLSDTLLAWFAFPTTKATGVFFDVAFPPWYNYSPANWWTGPAGGSTRQALIAWWSPRAQAYFDYLRTQFAPMGGHPRYLVIPNTDALVDGTDEPAYLDGTDGVFTENWQAVNANAGDWNLSVRRICKYVTGKAKVWMADITQAGTALSQADRELFIGTYMLVRNGTSYIMFGNGDLTWYPDYEIDLGGYVDEPPTDLEALRVAGTGGSSGGLYERKYVAGAVVVNSSAAALSYDVTSAMKRAAWSGGGVIANDGTLAAQSLTYATDVPAGMLSVPARSVVILRSPAGAPPPGEEPGGTTGGDGGTSGDGGATGGDGGMTGGGDGGSTGGGDGGANGDSGGGDTGGCGCRAVEVRAPFTGSALAAMVAFVALARRRRSRR